MPRSLYKKARGSGTKGNQDPVIVTAKGSKRSSHQVKDYVLCRDCEQRFSINGEEYVVGLVTKQNGEFPLLQALSGVQPTHEARDWKTYSSADTPTLDRSKIAYFGISVFWRASVHTWEQEDGNKVRIELGPRYSEEVRRYLLGQAPMPRNAALQVIVCSDAINQQSFFLPGENQKVRDRSVIFLARGILFFFRISNTLKDFQKRLSVVNNPYGWITVRDCSDRPVWRLGDR